MIFGKQVLLYIYFTQITGAGHRNDVIVTSRDTDQRRKQANNGDKGYMLVRINFH